MNVILIVLAIVAVVLIAKRFIKEDKPDVVAIGGAGSSDTPNPIEQTTIAEKASVVSAEVNDFSTAIAKLKETTPKKKTKTKGKKK